MSVVGSPTKDEKKPAPNVTTSEAAADQPQNVEVLEDTPEAYQKRREEEQAKLQQAASQKTTEENKGK